MLLLLASNLPGQNLDHSVITKDDKGEIDFIKTSSHTAQRLMSNGDAFLRSVHNATGETEFRLIRTHKDEDSQIHQVYKQHFKGIPIEEGYYIIHGKADSIEIAN